MKILNASPGFGVPLSEQEIKDFLTTRKLSVHLGTVDEKGDANIHPVWYYYDPLNNKIYIETSKQSKKIDNLRRKENVYFCIDDPSTPYKGVRGKGSVKIHEDVNFNVHFLVLSTETSFRKYSEQYSFVIHDLTQASNNANINWIVVYFHSPMYSSLSGSLLRDVYHPLFDNYGVDLVLYADRHYYDRSYPLEYNSDNSSKSIISDSHQNKYNDPRGQIYATVGTAGAHLKDLLEKLPYIVTQYKGHGFLNVDLINNGTTLSAKFYANDGTIRDQFTITKLAKNPNTGSLGFLEDIWTRIRENMRIRN